MRAVMTTYILTAYRKNSPQVKDSQKKLTKLIKDSRNEHKHNREHAKTTQSTQFYPNIMHVHDKNVSATLKDVTDGDTIRLYAEGLPACVFDHPDGNLQFSAYELAHYFASLKLPNKINLTIDLHACVTAVKAQSAIGQVCFAQDFSKALAAKNYSNITVIGYTGWIQYKSFFKESVSGELAGHGSKSPHCDLAQAAAYFHNGICIHQPQRVLIADNQMRVDASMLDMSQIGNAAIQNDFEGRLSALSISETSTTESNHTNLQTNSGGSSSMMVQPSSSAECDNDPVSAFSVSPLLHSAPPLNASIERQATNEFNRQSDMTSLGLNIHSRT